MNVILSIKPEFVEKIFSGEKRYEYRKVSFKQDIDTVYIYASRPVSKIVGEFKIADIIIGDSGYVWKRTKDYGGVTKTFYDSYYKGKCKSVAIEIKNPVKYNKPVPLNSERYKIPQSFIYTAQSFK